MKKLFSNFIRKLIIITISILLSGIILVFSVMIWPTSGPNGETVGGKFITYFNNIRGDCGPNEVIYGFNDDFSKKCKEIHIECLISDTTFVGSCITQ